MNARTCATGSRWLLGLCLFGSLGSVGCLQTTMGGQTLPSAYYLEDDVQYFPAGPETKLSNQIRALERYKVERESLQDGAGQLPAY
ncbi:MAG TPA: hypothetical protein VFG20_16865 [Planctomycetaceae bacterium]|nr:hypothetical protein [Planctomycetaceae bacterium]